MKFKEFCVLGCFAAGFSGSANADVIYNFNASSASSQTATATFDFSSPNTLVLTLTNTSTITDISYILDEFHFLLSGTPTTSSLTSIMATGGAETCTTTTGPPPHITTCTNDPTTDQTGTWGLVATSGQIDMYSDGTQNHPNGIANSSFITNAALDGLSNPQHNPVLMGPVDLHISFTGFTTTPTISDVVFGFGTTPDLVNGTTGGSTGGTTGGSSTSGGESSTGGNIPEPATLALLGLGLFAVALASRRRAGAIG